MPSEYCEVYVTNIILKSKNHQQTLYGQESGNHNPPYVMKICFECARLHTLSPTSKCFSFVLV